MITSQSSTLPTTSTRRWHRYKISVPIRVVLATPSKTTIIDGRGHELSEGGMALMAGVELRLEDQIVVEFTPPYSNSPIRVKGAVRNRQGYRYGIEFLWESAVEANQVDRLRQMLSVMSQTG